MTLHLDLPQSVEQQLSASAAQRHMPVDAYVLQVLDRSAGVLLTPASPPQDFPAYLRSLALFVENVPNYPEDFWTRDIISGDEDERPLEP